MFIRSNIEGNIKSMGRCLTYSEPSSLFIRNKQTTTENFKNIDLSKIKTLLQTSISNNAYKFTDYNVGKVVKVKDGVAFIKNFTCIYVRNGCFFRTKRNCCYFIWK